MGGQHQRVDRPGLPRDSKGGRRQEEVETAGFKVIVGAPTTLRVTGLMMYSRKHAVSLVVFLSSLWSLRRTGRLVVHKGQAPFLLAFERNAKATVKSMHMTRRCSVYPKLRAAALLLQFCSFVF